jgi:ATP-dependent Clp protease adaptor protein ClpS
VSKKVAVAVAEPEYEIDEQVETTRDERRARKRQPRYNVILWDSDDHSYDYVIRMLRELFGFGVERGFLVAEKVHLSGRAICLTTTMEHAELKRDQIHAYGKDILIGPCLGSMQSTIEPVD